MRVLRLATELDWRLLFDLRNSPEVVALSHEGNTVEWEEHVAWCEQTAGERGPYRNFLIDVKGVVVGYLRLRWEDPLWWRVSLLIRPWWRRRGHGQAPRAPSWSRGVLYPAGPAAHLAAARIR